MDPISAHKLTKTAWWLYAAAAASLLTTLTLPYVGEEAVYTITSLEMWVRGEFFVNTLYGTNYGRPPLLNWLVIPLANLLGWEHVLVASRLVTAGATAATGLALAWLARNLTGNRALAAFAALVFLSGDALFYRGWLAYADSLFTLGVFGAIACLWAALARRRPALLWLAVIALTCGFLAKVQTAYLFYGIALVVLAFDRGYRRELLRVHSVLAHAAGLAAFAAWHVYATSGAQSTGTLADIVLKLQTVGVAAYFAQLWSFPLETFARFLPASGLALYFWYRARRTHLQSAGPRAIGGLSLATLTWIVALNYLPYWIGPKTHIRYIMPLYPLFALLIAALIWRLGEARVRVAVAWLAAVIALKFVVGLWAFPAYQEKFRGNYAATAADIAERTRGHPLYATDVSATGLSVAAHIDVLRHPAAPPLTWPPAQWDSGFLLSYTANPEVGPVVRRYKLGGNDLFLLCRGAACTGSAANGRGTADRYK